MIGLYRGVSGFSRAIRWQTRSIYSHAAWIGDDLSVVEAWIPNGVRHMPHYCDGHTPGTVIDVFTFHGLTPGEREGVSEFLLAQVGKPYDYWGVIGFVSRRNRKLNGKWFCSEIIMAAFEAIHRPLLLRIEPWKVPPGMIPLSPLLHYVGQRRTYARTA